MAKWDDYTQKRDLMIATTHSAHAPWTIIRANDKRRARIAAIRRILRSFPYDGRDMAAIGEEDTKSSVRARRSSTDAAAWRRCGRSRTVRRLLPEMRY